MYRPPSWGGLGEEGSLWGFSSLSTRECLCVRGWRIEHKLVHGHVHGDRNTLYVECVVTGYVSVLFLTGTYDNIFFIVAGLYVVCYRLSFFMHFAIDKTSAVVSCLLFCKYIFKNQVTL